MSVNVTHYFGVGIELPVNFDLYDEVINSYPQYCRYECIRNTTKEHSNVRLIQDSMNGLYTYLMFVIKETHQEDMFDSNSTVGMLLDFMDKYNVLDELKEAYPKFTGGEELPVDKVNIISLFHVS